MYLCLSFLGSGRNWFHAYIRVQYPFFRESNGFSLILLQSHHQVRPSALCPSVHWLRGLNISREEHSVRNLYDTRLQVNPKYKRNTSSISKHRRWRWWSFWTALLTRCHGSHDVMMVLWHVIKRDMPPETWCVYYEFTLPGPLLRL